MRDAAGSNLRLTNASGIVDADRSQELDVVGADAGLRAPLNTDPPLDEGGRSLLAYPNAGSPSQQRVSYTIDHIPVPVDMFINHANSHFTSSFEILGMTARASQGTASHWTVHKRDGTEVGKFAPGEGNQAASLAVEYHGYLVRNWLVTDSAWNLSLIVGLQ